MEEQNPQTGQMLDQLVTHFTRYQGQPAAVFQLNHLPTPTPQPLLVLEFAPPSPEYDWMYLTAGMSCKPMPHAQRRDHRIELLMYSNQRLPKLAEVIGQLASYPFINETYFAVGHTIAGRPNDPIVEGSSLTEFLLTPVYFEPDGFDNFQVIHGYHVEILWATPIYLSERLYIQQHGWRSLVEDLFTENEVQPANLNRPAVV